MERENKQNIKGIIVYILLFSCFTILTGCLPLMNSGFDDIKLNASREEVVKNIGTPFIESQFYSKTYMTYYVHNSLFSLIFNKSEFPYIGFYPLLRTGVEHWVILDDGKVVAYGPSKSFNGGNIPKALDAKSPYIVDISGAE